MATDRAISYQSGIRQFNANISKYTGMLGGLTPDIHTLRSLNPETTNRTICVMYRGPYFLMRYFGGKANTYRNTDFVTYKKMIEYYNTGITPNIGEGTLASANLQGGFAGRSIPIPTTQNTQSGQTLSISVPELVGRPMSNFHNMWVDGISDSITGLTTYHGLVAGSIDDQGIAQRIFKVEGGDELALEPSPAWEVAEFMLIALDRSGARVEGAIAALGCTPASKVGNQDLFTTNAQGASSIQNLQIVFNCQYVQSAYINDLASRYVNQFAVFGNSLNFNPGAGDAFWATSEDASGRINRLLVLLTESLSMTHSSHLSMLMLCRVLVMQHRVSLVETHQVVLLQPQVLESAVQYNKKSTFICNNTSLKDMKKDTRGNPGIQFML